MAREIPEPLTTALGRTTDHSDPIEALRASRGLFKGLSTWQSQLVAEAVESGATWEQVGAALGTSRQAAWARFREIAERTQERRTPMAEEAAALQRRLKDDVRALEARLKALDGEWREARDGLQQQLRELDRQRVEERKALQQDVRETATTLREEIRRLREPPK
jgi:hypothetical protein